MKVAHRITEQQRQGEREGEIAKLCFAQFTVNKAKLFFPIRFFFRQRINSDFLISFLFFFYLSQIETFFPVIHTQRRATTVTGANLKL